jgi:transcriptional regulator with XRE-family HTH domain
MEYEMSSSDKEEKRNWLLSALEQTGLKASPFAKKAGVSPSTVLDFLKNPDKKNPPSDRIFQILAQEHNLTPLFDSPYIPVKNHFSEDGAQQLTPEYLQSEKQFDQIKMAYSGDAEKHFYVMSGRALENEDIRDGDILVVDYKRSPKSNDIVCISLRDEEKMSAQTIFRKYIEKPPVTICITTTNDASIQPNVLFPDGNQVKIYGVVSMHIRIK